jgi:hypothetical protein
MNGPEIPGRRPFEAPSAIAGVAPQGDGDSVHLLKQAGLRVLS